MGCYFRCLVSEIRVVVALVVVVAVVVALVVVVVVVVLVGALRILCTICIIFKH